MSYLSRMYGKSQKTSSNQKNPARVSGGLRAQGMDSYSFLDESGLEKHVPSQKYVASLEEQIKTLRQQNNILEKKTSRLATQVDQMESAVRNMMARRA